MTNLLGFMDVFPFLSINYSLVLLQTVCFGTFMIKALSKVNLESINGMYTYIQELLTP